MFPADRFDAYTRAVVICPDSKLAEVEEWVEEKQAEWAVSELRRIKAMSTITTERPEVSAKLPEWCRICHRYNDDSQISICGRACVSRRYPSGFDWS